MADQSDLKPYFKDDIKRMLLSIEYTAEQAAKQAEQSGNGQSTEYQEGFKSALKAIAIMVGLITIIFLVIKYNPDLLTLVVV